MNRTTVHRPTNWWRHAALAGLAGGLAMAVYLALVYTLGGQPAWAPAQMVAATSPLYRPIPAGFSAGAVLMGVTLHLVTSAFWGLAYGGALRALSVYRHPRVLRSSLIASTLGPAWGLVTWLIMGLLIAPRINPSLNIADQTAYLGGHLVYGLTTGLTFMLLAARRHYAVTFAPSLEARTRDRERVNR